MMEADAGDIEFKDGKFDVVGTDKTIALVDVAKAFYAPMGPLDREVRRRARSRGQLFAESAEPSERLRMSARSRSIRRPAR